MVSKRRRQYLRVHKRMKRAGILTSKENIALEIIKDTQKEYEKEVERKQIEKLNLSPAEIKQLKHEALIDKFNSGFFKELGIDEIQNPQEGYNIFNDSPRKPEFPKEFYIESDVCNRCGRNRKGDVGCTC